MCGPRTQEFARLIDQSLFNCGAEFMERRTSREVECVPITTRPDTLLMGREA